MNKYQKLRKELLEATKFRGHNMYASSQIWSVKGRIIKTYSCKNCEMTATIDTKPSPNDIDLGGSALALNCFD